jgi:hypothetical protein
MPNRGGIQQSLQSLIRVGINPNMHPDQRHGTVYFNVSGFGRLRRDFIVDLPNDLLQAPRRFATDVAQQIMLIDPTLPKREALCRPVLMDIAFGGQKRVLDMATMELQLDQRY